jgi:NADH-quinone oxidoreductase subunit N
VLAMVSAVIAAYLYLRIMVSMWLSEPQNAFDSESDRRYLRAAVFISAVITALIGIYPDKFIGLTEQLRFAS